ncbi:hypothetical protein A2Z23_03105 [Candidatus Curtissbacteria bacterium RBG_16_39_7]|uniref:Phosphoribosyltransferase domain-containing protein n=1 Tax=Candidatus Curtissbacteria bacterium RBG_16_39_7 TaxID=1797707 RepID=A0A1F5G4D0_9BACT|nr:MAG: hypothetical protein A2Z23_03105 [Candidatus Curtissbacteria bacterium RBG_16_39_7]
MGNHDSLFQDRKEAGFLLAEKLKDLGFARDVLILGIPRGGVVVAKAVADILGADLDVICARKLGAPGNPELAIGAVGQEGKAVLDRELIGDLGVPGSYIKKEIEKQRKEAKRREIFFRKKRKPLEVLGREVILVDDGIATGSTVLAAGKIIKAKNPKKLVLAVPVAPLRTIGDLEGNFDQLVILETPADFGAVGRFYQSFPQVEDGEVKKLLTKK